MHIYIYIHPFTITWKMYPSSYSIEVHLDYHAGWPLSRGGSVPQADSARLVSHCSAPFTGLSHQ